MGATLLAGVLTVAAPQAEAQQEQLPIIFVHGLAGSGAQFESQAMRFASNGYPAELVSTFDYNSVGGDGTQSGELDGYVDQVRSQHGVDRVHLVGHSMGTAVLNGYILGASAKVASYTAVDGLPAICFTLRCQTISAASMGQSHVEAATSPEAFATLYEFIVGSPPSTTDILPEDGPIEIAGRAVNFPENIGVNGATLEVWPIDWGSGARIGSSPLASTTLDATGSFEFDGLEPGQSYELALSRPDTDITIHYYKQPFLRSDYIVRLNATGPNSGSSNNTNRGPNHTTSTVIRYREWWTNHSSGNNDVVGIYTRNGAGQVVEPPVSALENVTDNAVIGVHIHDDTATPGQSSLNLLSWFNSQVFQTGTDVYMPAEPGGAGTVSFVNAPRGQLDMPSWQVVNVPNWPSDDNHVIVEFNDFVQ